MIDGVVQQLSSGGGVVNKAELAALLGTSLPTLDKMLRQHGDRFPVVRRGTNGVSYEFDPAAVTTFLRDLEAARVAAGRAKDELMQQYTLPDIVERPDEKLTPRDLVQLAKLRQMERDEAIQAGFLVQTSDVRQAVYTAFGALRRRMGQAVRQACRNANIPEPVIRNIEAAVADAQRRFVAETKEALKQSTEIPADGDQTALL